MFLNAPGGNAEADEGSPDRLLDPEFDYKPRWRVQDDEVEDVVHRKADAEKQAKGKDNAGKKELLQTFLKDHTQAYRSVSQRRCPVRRSPNLSMHSAGEMQAARAHQKMLLETQKRDTDMGPSEKAFPQEAQKAQARPLSPQELPPPQLSPQD